MSTGKDEPEPLNSAIAAQRWALDVLRETAEKLKTAPSKQRADALLQLVSSLVSRIEIVRLRAQSAVTGGVTDSTLPPFVP